MSMTPDDARAIPWLSHLAEVPSDAAWPRLLTVPSGRATGSYGPAFLAWATEASGGGFRWWQQLTTTLTLAHDSDGRLVHRVVCPTSPRQVGKTWVMFWMCLWRLTFGTELFGEPQVIVSISKNLNLLKTAQAPMRQYARAHPDVYEVRDSGLETRIIHLASGSEWHLLSEQAGGYGRGVSLALVDEAWAIRPQTIDVALGPTQIERSSPQMILTSTANDTPTPLMIGRRALAVAELGDPDASTCWLEWSLPPDAPLDDMDLWRSVLPHWHDQRLDEIARAYQTAVATRSADPTQPDPLMSVASQMGNRWPASVESSPRRGEPLLDVELWEKCEEDHDPAGPLKIGLEDFFGKGACIALAGGLADGRVFVETEVFDEPEARSKAFDRAADLLGHYQGSQLLVGASLERDPRAVELRAELAGAKETAVGLPLLRSLLADGRLVHFGAGALSEQLAEVRATRTATGQLALVAGPRSDAVRATAWAVNSLEQEPPLTPRIY